MIKLSFDTSMIKRFPISGKVNLSQFIELSHMKPILRSQESALEDWINDNLIDQSKMNREMKKLKGHKRGNYSDCKYNLSRYLRRLND